ncbi:MAG: EamA family transporter RarD, partial [Propionibacteriaceae bacterium]|nr:EamA family transporter RarD [Propionibacteriaceae bacterium]
MSQHNAAEAAERPTNGRGALLALATYGLWGVFPLYFHLLAPAGPVEIIAQRVVWSFLFCLAGVIAWRRLPELRLAFRTPRLCLTLLAAGALVSVNWLVYIWAVFNDHIVDGALGYFIQPLLMVVLAVLVLGERLRPAQWVAVGIGLLAVLVLSIGYGRVPWVALALAVSFGLYSLIKNRVGGRVSPLIGLAVETSGLAPLGLIYLIWLASADAGTFLGHGPLHASLLISTGIATVVPLVMFAAAAARIPLSML